MNKRILSLLAIALTPAYSFAVDGVTLINQSTVTAAGGFPYVISQPGSYRLSGNLTVSSATTNTIVIAANNVTIDLNGVAILGPLDLSASASAHNGTGPGYGNGAGSDSPVQNYSNITIRNGTIQGMGADGVHLLADGILLEDLHVRTNGGSGLVFRLSTFGTQMNAIVRHNTVQANSNYGIKGDAGVVTENTASQNGFSGIWINNGTVANNLVLNNGEDGLLLETVSYFGNTIAGNNSGGAQVSGGINTGQNVCGTAVCP